MTAPIKKCSSSLWKKFAVNVEVREKERIVSKGQGNHILDLRRCLTNKKVLRNKFTGLENPCTNPHKVTGSRSRVSCPRKIMRIF